MLGALVVIMIDTPDPKRDPESDPEPDRHRCTVFHGPSIIPSQFGAQSRALWRPIDELAAAGVADAPAVLLVDGSSNLPTTPSHVVVVATDATTHRALDSRAHVSLAGVCDAAARKVVLDVACQLSCARLAALRRRRQVGRSTHKVRELNRVGLALMRERDREALLGLILKLGKELTASDGAGIFLSQTTSTGNHQLRATLYDFDSLPEASDLTGLKIGINHDTIVGHAAATQRTIVVDDAYQLASDLGFNANKYFDEQYGYYRRSGLVVPMVDHLGRSWVFWSSRTARPIRQR